MRVFRPRRPQKQQIPNGPPASQTGAKYWNGRLRLYRLVLTIICGAALFKFLASAAAQFGLMKHSAPMIVLPH